MKLKYYFLALIALSIKSVSGQIQLSADDVYLPGNYKMGQDNAGGYAIGTPGANKVWDFSSLKSDVSYEFDISFFTPKIKDMDANYVKTDGTDTFEFIRKTNSALYNLRPIVNFSEIHYYPMKTMQFPISYNDSLLDSIGLVYYYKASDLGVSNKDSVRLTYHEYQSTLADAWGTLKLPNGAFATLRVRSNLHAVMYMEGKSGTGPYTRIPQYDYDEQFTQYKWYSKAQGSNLATYDANDDYMDFLVDGNVGIRRRAANECVVKFVNPMSEAWKVTNPGKNKLDLQLFDATGKVVKQDELLPESEHTIHTTDLLQGIYYLELTDKVTGSRQAYTVMK